MSYIWTDGELITAEKLNETNDNSGLAVIKASLVNVGYNRWTLNYTGQQIIDLVDSQGFVPFVQQQHLNALYKWRPGVLRLITNNSGYIFSFRMLDATGQDVIFRCESLDDYPTFDDLD